MSILREGTNRVWGAFVLMWLLGSAGLDFYWLFTETGPVRALAEMQAGLTGGSWYPKLTIMILLLGQIGVLLAIKFVIEKATGKRLTPPVPRS